MSDKIMVKDSSKSCVSCKREDKAWIYCGIFNNEMLEIKGFDETGELHGCNYYMKMSPREVTDLFISKALEVKKEVFG